MPRRGQPSLKQLRELCGQPGPDDGIDPRETLRQHARSKGGRKAQQLCGQVSQALNYALAAVCDDDVLRDLLVISVAPAPDESRLLVSVGSALGATCDPAQVLAHLSLQHARLRAEVAASIHRKKVPELTFCVLDAAE
jgi:ribosome-binding factor A